MNDTTKKTDDSIFFDLGYWKFHRWKTESHSKFIALRLRRFFDESYHLPRLLRVNSSTLCIKHGDGRIVDLTEQSLRFLLSSCTDPTKEIDFCKHVFNLWVQAEEMGELDRFDEAFRKFTDSLIEEDNDDDLY